MGDITANFSRIEFACPCCKKNEISSMFIEQLQKLRNLYGKEMKISSGYRCPSHNTAVKGKPNSMHLRGIAADILMPNPNEYYQFIKCCMHVGFTGIGFGDGFVHLDIRDAYPVCFTY